jgi:hypothetical protein
MTAQLSVSTQDADGPVAISGDEAGGAGLFLDKGRPIYLYNATAREAERFALTGPQLVPGAHEVTIAVKPVPSSGPRAARLAMLVDGKEVAAKDVPIFYAVRGGGVIGRYGVRTLLAGTPGSATRNLIVDNVQFIRR